MSEWWPQRARFRELARSYATRNGLTNDQVAPLLGLKPQSLQKYLYGNTKRPGRKVLVKAAEVFQCSLGELFLDNPGAVVPDGLDAVDQFRFETIVEKMNGPDLTAADRQILFEDFISSYNRLITLKAGLLKK